MTYPVVRFVIALITGIVTYETIALPNWPIYLIGSIGLFAFLQGLIPLKNRSVTQNKLFQGFGALILFFTLGWYTTWMHDERNTPTHLTRQTDSLVAYEAVITGQPEARARSYRVLLSLSRGKTASGWRPVSGAIIAYLDKATAAGIPVNAPVYGQRWLVYGTPVPVEPPKNPGSLDYKRYLRHQQIHYQQFIRPHQRLVLSTGNPNPVKAWAISLNQWADSVFAAQISSRTEYGIVKAMLLGATDSLDPDTYTEYATAGAIHILSVSGLHVSILFLALTWVVSLVKRKARYPWIWPAVQLYILWFYALMTGLEPAVLRSAGMFTVLILAKAMDRPQSLANSLAVSALFVLFFSPYTLFSAGFQLSYLAVAGIGTWHPGLYQSVTFKHPWVNKLWEVSSVALVAQLITFPLAVYYFHQFPTYFLLANPVVLVLSNVLLYTGMAALLFSWIPYVNTLAGFFLQKIVWLMNGSVQLVGQLPKAALENLWLSAEELVLLYALIFAVVWAITSRKIMAPGLAACLSFWLAGSLLMDDYQLDRQQRFAVHYLPHYTAISVTDGHKATLLTDFAPSKDQRTFDFHLKNTFGQWAVDQITPVDLTEDSTQTNIPIARTEAYTLWVVHGKSILIINKLNRHAFWRLPAVVDIAVIRKNALRNWQQLDGRVVARNLILDSSNSPRLTARLLAEARTRHIPCFSVNQQGAFLAEK
ncbi:ComEC/Rec2 family competence protein [Arsenicibacter rosenii]|uniref:Competence protein ComEC n=1 Tax=Arsenicibacter rosenii TaxID=1750698 RepID=A0A1S2VQY7_9BACT|nr:ComEC/Rec2 family competence protein [Arsenicibacter rosenii]OIN61154.1 hypothetical protein BLX24_03580 [Arsenicibacter rosenii]